MATTARIGNRKTWTVNVGAYNGGTHDHSKLFNRDADDQHPMGAIKGLETFAKNTNAHMASKENPHGVTASQVGARPDTWMPTAAQVGAAPDGYGLGTTATDISNQNLITATVGKSGFYRGENVTHAPETGWWRYYVNAGVNNSTVLAIDNDDARCYTAVVYNNATSVVWNKVYTDKTGLCDTSSYLTAATEDEITARLNDCYASTPDYAAKIFCLAITAGGLTLSGGNWFVTVYRSWNQYGYAEAVSYGDNGGQKFTRDMYGGSWGGWKNAGPSAFAPAGYGLGAKLGRHCDNINTAKEMGLYYTTENTTGWGNDLVLGMKYASLFVENRTGDIYQTLTSTNGYSTLTKLVRCSKDDGLTWTPWEYENPPMIPGVEYRTTERWNDMPVYTKLIDCGNSANDKYISLGIPGQLIRSSGTCASILMPVKTASADLAWYMAEATGITIYTNNYNDKPVKIQIWYIRN